MSNAVKVGQKWAKTERDGRVRKFTITKIATEPNMGALRATAKRPNGSCFFPDTRDLAAGRSGYTLMEDVT